MNKQVLLTRPLFFVFSTNFFAQKISINFKRSLKLICVIILFWNSINGYAQSPYTSLQSGNWNDDATWSGTGIPGAADVVYIDAQHKITVTANAACTSIIFIGLVTDHSFAAEIIVNSTFTLAVSSGITVNSKQDLSNNCIISGGGTLNAVTVTIGQTGLTPLSARSTAITSTISNFNISGNLSLHGRGTGSLLNTAYFLHPSGNVKIDGQISSTNQTNNTTVYDMSAAPQTGTLLLNSGGSGPFAISGGTLESKLNGTASTVNYTGANQTVRGTAYTNLTLSGSGTKTLSTGLLVGGNLTSSGTVSVTVPNALTIGGNLNVGTGTTLATSSSFTLGVTGTTAVVGILTLAGSGTKTFTGATTISGTVTSSGNGAKTFTGNTTINAGGVWNETVASLVNYGASLQNNGTYTASTGAHNFTGTASTINGALVISSVTVSGTATNTGTLTIATALTGTGTLTNAGTLNLGGTAAISNLTASAVSNTVNYTGTAQLIKTASYNNLILSGSGTKTFSGTPSTISGNLSILSGVLAALGTGLTHTATSMTLGGEGTATGLWGSTTATGANFKNDIYFTATTGMVNVGTNTCNTPLRVTSVTQCQGDTSKALNEGSTISGNQISGNWDIAVNPVADHPTLEANGFDNTAVCAFVANTQRSYVATSFQVSVSGTYTFVMDDNTTYDGMGYIYSGNFVPGNCSGGGTFIRGDDDSRLLIIIVTSNEPSMSAALVAGVNYTLISTTSSASSNASFSWTVTPPFLSGGVLIAPKWYKTPNVATAIGTGESFNPVGVDPALPNTDTPGTYTYYVGFTGCRTPVNYVINPNPVIIGNLNVCVGTTTTLTAAGTPDATSPWVSATPAVATVNSVGFVTGVSVGTSIITYTNSNGCKTTATITVGARPTVTPAASTVAICSPVNAATTTLSYTATGTPTSYSISWNTSPPNNFLAVTDAPLTASPITINVPAGTSGGTYTGTLSVKNTNGCTSLGVNFSVNINASPILVTTGVVDPVCFKTSNQTSSMPYSSSSDIISYSIDWNAVANSAGLLDQGSTTIPFVSGTGTVTNILVPANVAANTYSGIITITSNNNCTRTQILSITVRAIPTSPIAGTIVHPNCITPTGNVPLSGLVSTGTWLINQMGTVNNTYSGTGSTFTISGLAPGNYTFTIQDGVNCPSLPSINIQIIASVTNLWNGTSWSKGSPPTNEVDVVQFSGDYQTSVDLKGCSCIVNPGVNVVVNSGHTLTIANSVNNNGGTLTFENNASLLQKSEAVNTGNIIYKRDTSPVRRYDFTFWSSPVTRTPSFTLYDLSSETLWDKYYKYDPAVGWIIIFNGAAQMEAGRGYIIRAPQNHDLHVPSVFNGRFIGIPNNGNITVPLGEAERSCLLGNPYPSAIYADQFIVDNTANLYGTLYFWTHNSPPSDDVDGDAKYNYTLDDYAIYNLTGSTTVGDMEGDGATTPGYQEPPHGYIAAGQSFFVKSKTALNAVFTNSMRVPGLNSQFFKNTAVKKENETGHRVWLNLTNTQGAFKQILIGYVEGATNSWDNNYDGLTMDGNKYLDFYSINEMMKLVIQGRSLPFLETDVVPLGYRSIIVGEFTISIDHANGDLSTHDIYLEDKLIQKMHNLKTSNYNFNTAIGTFDDRFVLHYVNKSLGTVDVEGTEQRILVSVKEQTIKVMSTKENISEVSVFDVTGRLLYNKIKVNATELQIANLQSGNQVLLVKTTLESGYTTSKKILF